MNATEPSVPVPVSQVIQWRNDLQALLPPGTYAILRELDALISQSAATVEPMCTCGHIMDDHDLSETRECQVAVPWCPCANATDTAAPPRIADMAPGTTFTAAMLPADRGGYRPEGWERTRRWFVFGSGKGVRVVSDSGWPYQPEDVDPSTIRDVTPPRAGSEITASDEGASVSV